jgi:hypothetical protein
VAGIKGAVFDAVVQRQTHKVNLFDSIACPNSEQDRVSSMGVVEKRTIIINVSLGALVKNMSDAAGVE